MELVIITKFLSVPLRVIKVNAPREGKPLNWICRNQEIDPAAWEQVNNRGIRGESVSGYSQ